MEELQLRERKEIIYCENCGKEIDSKSESYRSRNLDIRLCESCLYAVTVFVVDHVE
jgi:ribosome-binding protein aMBF1 (putative translation factor)